MKNSPYWEVAPLNRELTLKLAEDLGLPPLLIHLLLTRGLNDPHEIYRHLNPKLSDFPDPFLLEDMEKAVNRLVKAIYNREKITIYGDYDVDGTTGAAILYLFLKELGLEPLVIFPHRERDGYGLHPHLIASLKERGISLLISVDCGISAHEACRVARENGLEVIITDHHEVPEEISEALAVINPKRKGNRYPFRELAGVGVAFALLRALRQRLYEEGFFGQNPPKLKNYLDLVALGTIADIVPLTGENRLIAWFGLRELKESERPGLKALKKLAGLENGLVDTNSVMFRLAPRINAAGRLKEAELAFKLFVTTDETEAKTLAEELHQLNAKRQQIEDRILKEALAKIEKDLGPDRLAYVLSGEDWPLGIIGIVASRLQEALYRPVILLTLKDGLARGSGRSIPEINLYQCLSDCRQYLKAFGGHPAAAGLKILEENISAFARKFEEIIKAKLDGKIPRPRLKLDAWVRVRHILEPSFLENFIRLEPFGPGYPEPLFGLKNFEVRNISLVKEKHLKLFVWQEGLGLPAIAFRFGNSIPKGIKAIAGNLEISAFQGRNYLQLRIKDLV
ncbi:single-stranded-DNA-specific exonuclease RecJ [Thermodesulfatator autotrophicus]|nr:single-stranded-DNA-specific exonuclease RecJ [Thermodesulfatator autotrophicus]